MLKRNLEQQQISKLDTLTQNLQGVIDEWGAEHLPLADALRSTSEVSIPPIPVKLFYKKNGFGTDTKFFNLVGVMSTYLCNSIQVDSHQLTGFFTLINMITPDVLTTPANISKLKEYAIDLKLVEVPTVNDFLNHFTIADAAVKNHILSWFFEELIDWGDGGEIIIKEDVLFSFNLVETLEFNTRFVLVFGSVLFMLMFKVVNKNNFDGWIKNRWRTFTGTLSVPMDPKNGLGPSVLPTLTAALELCRLTTGCPPVRKSLFIRMSDLATRDGVYNKTAVSIMNLIKGVELGHISMIIEFIVNRHPEVIHHKLIRPEITRLLQALGTIKTKAGSTVAAFQYMKIYLPPEQTAPLNRQNFPNSIYLAKKIGEKVVATIGNYTTAYDDKPGSITKALDALAERVSDIEQKIENGDLHMADAVRRTREQFGPLREITEILTPGENLEETIQEEVARDAFNKMATQIKPPNTARLLKR